MAIKEASGNLEQVDEIIKNKPNDFDVISGDDSLTFPMVSCGAVGVISVIGNALPKEFSRMIRLQMRGEYDPARTIHHRFTDLFSLLFVDGICLVTTPHGQGKDHTIHLQLLVGGKVKDKVVKQFIHRFRCGRLTDEQLQCVYGSGINRIGYRVGLRLFRPLRLASRTGEHQQDTCDNRKQKPLHLTI